MAYQNKVFYFFSLFFVVLSYSATLKAQSNVSTGILYYKNSNHFTSFESTYFNPDYADQYGSYRYGMGYAGLEVGSKNVAINAKAHGGISIVGWNGQFSGLGPHIGIEMYNGELRANSTTSFNNFYLYNPAIAPGIQGAYKSFKYTLNYRRGYVFSNYYKEQGWGPIDDTMDGLGLYLYFNKVKLTYEVTHFAHLEKQLLSLAFYKLNFMVDRDQLGKSVSIGYKLQF